MVGPRAPGDDRAVSEATSVAILVGFTILVTASVGIGVLFVEDGDSDGVPNANFTFSHYSNNGMLVITHQRGDAIPAGQLVLSGPPGSVTWAEIAGSNESEPVEPTDVIQLSRNNAWGERVRSTDTVELYYSHGDGNQTLLDSWSG